MPLRPDGLGSFLLAVETVPGAPESLTDQDAAARYIENAEINWDQENLERTGDGPRPRAWKPVAGREDYPFSFDAELSEIEVEDANSNPAEWPVLNMCGFTRVASVAGNPKTLTFTRGSFPSASSTFAAREGSDDNTENDYWIAAGCVADWEIEISRDATWKLKAVNGNAKSLNLTEVGAALEALDYENAFVGAPIVGGNAHFSFKPVGGSDYAGNGGCLHSATIRGNMNPIARNTVCGRVVQLRPRMGTTMTVVLERVSLSDFNPYTLRNAKTGIEVMIASRDLTFTGEVPAAAGNWAHVFGTYVITSITKGADLELRTWEIELSEIHPNASSDGGGLDTDGAGFRLVQGTRTA